MKEQRIVRSQTTSNVSELNELLKQGYEIKFATPIAIQNLNAGYVEYVLERDKQCNDEVDCTLV